MSEFPDLFLAVSIIGNVCSGPGTTGDGIGSVVLILTGAVGKGCEKLPVQYASITLTIMTRVRAVAKISFVFVIALFKRLRGTGDLI